PPTPIQFSGATSRKSKPPGAAARSGPSRARRRPRPTASGASADGAVLLKQKGGAAYLLPPHLPSPHLPSMPALAPASVFLAAWWAPISAASTNPSPFGSCSANLLVSPPWAAPNSADEILPSLSVSILSMPHLPSPHLPSCAALSAVACGAWVASCAASCA